MSRPRMGRPPRRASGRLGARVGAEQVRFVQADPFACRTEDGYGLGLFGFWLSHVPPDRFEQFWALVRDCPEPGGRVLFADDTARPSGELVHGEESPVVERRLPDGTAHREPRRQGASSTVGIGWTPLQAHRPGLGQVQSVSLDLQYLHEVAPAITPDDVSTEVLHAADLFLDLHDLGVDERGMRHWTGSDRTGRTPGTA